MCSLNTVVTHLHLVDRTRSADKTKSIHGPTKRNSCETLVSLHIYLSDVLLFALSDRSV